MTKSVFLNSLWFFLVGVPPPSTATDYCRFTSDHVLCGNKGYAPKCGDPSKVRMMSMDPETRAKILDIHNKYRDLVASGAATAYGSDIFPPASNMEQLVWDTELESTAKGFSKRCSFDHSCQDCKRVDRFDVVGENIHLKFSSVPDSWKAMIGDWTYNEAKRFDVGVVKSNSWKKNKYGYGFGKVGHLVQAIWAETTHIGCAQVIYKSGTLSVCHYGAGGNFQNVPIYKAGKQCSACPGGRGCSKTYSNLCSPKGRGILIPTAAGTITLHKIEAIILLTSLMTLAFL